MSSTFNAIRGLPELRRKLAELPDKVEKKVLRSAWRKTAKTLQVAVKAKTPVDSGELKKRITVRAAKRKKHGIGLKVWAAATRVSKKFPGEGYPYALAVEAGHEYPRRGKNTHKKRIVPHETEFGKSFVRPHPFVRPAWNATQNELLDTFAKEAGAGIERVAKENI
jgi:HK97 gp10 family phage protein